MIDRLKSKQGSVGVVGLGYVGLPLLLAYAKAGFRAVGIDIDAAKPEALLGGRSYIKHIPDGEVAEALASGRLEATTDFAIIAGLDAVILCVPTPLDEHFEPDLSYVVDTVESVVPHLKAGQVLSLESTTYPGTTDEEVVTRVEKAGFTVGKDIHVVYSPEREDPGNPKFSAANIPKVVGGVTAACLEAGVALYEAAFEQVVPVSSCKVAELTKLLENIYRAVNIGLVNELKIAADRMGIDIWEVIRAASTKPFGFTPFYPGPGLGGHCIPIDPFYLTWKAREFEVPTRFIELAGEVNADAPRQVISALVEALSVRSRKSLAGARVLLLGLAYKKNVDDMRESPSLTILEHLEERGAMVEFYDPFIPVVPPTREHAALTGRRSIEWTAETLAGFDAALICTDHDSVDYQQLVEAVPVVVDSRNATSKVTNLRDRIALA